MDQLNPFNLDRVLQDIREMEEQACFICGSMTRANFFGVPLCYPYDDDGYVVKRCKWIYRDGYDEMEDER